MILISMPRTDAHATDVIVDVKGRLILTSTVISASLLLTQRKKKIMARSPRTHKVLLRNGSEARAVKFHAGNYLNVLNWIPGAEYRERISANGQVTQQRLMVPLNGTKRIKAAYFDDWIVKGEDGFYVVKFNETENAIFFRDSIAWKDENQMKRAFKRWAAEEVA